MIEITLWTDPACPFAFSAEPQRLRLRWLYGEQLTWRPRIIVLTHEPGEAEKLAGGAAGLQKKYGMPIDPEPRSRPASSEPACRLVVAARLHAPTQEEVLLRQLRVRCQAGGLLDDPELLDASARGAGLDPAELRRWSDTDEVAEALATDVREARAPSPAARALDHKLGGPDHERRYSAPSYEMRIGNSGSQAPPRVSTSASHALPGFNPPEAYDAAIANLDPSLERRPAPKYVTELLAWAETPLATAEVAAIIGTGLDEAAAALTRVATRIPAGADAYWKLHG